jgi:ATP-binding cassette subfamily C protein
MKLPIVWMAIFSIAANALVLAVPLYMLQVYDRVLSSQSYETLIFLSLIAIGAIVALGILEVARSMLAQRAGVIFEARLAPIVHRSLLTGPATGSTNLGDVQPLRDMAAIRSFLASRVAIALYDLPFIPLFAGVVFLVHPVLGWLTVAGALIVVMLAVANQMATSQQEQKAGEAAMRAAAEAQAQKNAGDDMRAMAMVDRGFGSWGALEADSINGQDRVGRINAWFFGASRTVRMLLQISILGLGAFFVLSEGLSAGIIFAASIVSARALAPIDQAIGGWRNIIQARLAWRRLAPLARMANRSLDTRTKLPEPQGRMAVDTLVYTPVPNSEPVLKGLSFRVKAGECLAIVGPSGAGKTTLARILSGALTPTSGTVRLDDIALANWNASDRGRMSGYLAQDLNLLPASVATNIARLEDEPDDDAVVRAALFTGGHELIGRLPQGYETPIGAGGVPLSGGQRQRIALARAFFGSPKLVILDEPNAHLDEAGNRALDATLGRAKQAGITVIIITQRREVLKRADRVMVLKEGRIEIFGPRDEVIDALAERAPARPRPTKVAPLTAHRDDMPDVSRRRVNT